jgi:tripartite ATP-independent transporter DctM subunit
MLIALILLVVFLGLMFIGVPIPYAMIGTSIFTLKILLPHIPLVIIPQRILSGVSNYILLCIPFFMLTAEIMSMTSLFDRLINLVKAFIGHVSGGLSHVNIVVSMFFAGITGAATADTSAVGGILIPAMEKDGYTKSYSTAVTVTSSTIGVIIPPSNLMVVAALATGTSVVTLFLAGIIPGILSGLAQLTVSLLYARKKGFPSKEKMSFHDRMVKLVWGIPAIGMPIIIIGGILGGILTATEASNITVFYSIIIGIVILRDKIPWHKFFHSMATVITRISAIMFTVGASMVFGWILAIAEVPDAIGTFIGSITTNPIIIRGLFILIYLSFGTFLDPLPAILIFTPIFMPIATTIGEMSVVHFAVTMVFGFVIGLVTPPVGSCLYVGAAISGLQINQFLRDEIPFVLGIIVILIIIMYIPELVTYIPEVLLG